MRWKDSATGAGGGGPDVDDAGGHLQRGGGLEDGLDPLQLGRRRSAGPDGAVAQRLDVLRLLGGQLLPRRVVTEHAELAEIGFRHGWLNPLPGRGYSASADRARSIGVGRFGGDGATSGSSTMNLVSPGLGLHPKVAVVLLDDDPAGQVQAEAGALAERLGGEERIEDVLDDVRGDAGAVVADLDANHLFVLTHRA